MKKLPKILLLLMITCWSAAAVLLMDVDVQTASCTLYFARECVLAAQVNAALAAVVWLALLWLYRRMLFSPLRLRAGDVRRGLFFSVPLAGVLALSPAYQQGDEALALFFSPYHTALLLFKLLGWAPLLFALYGLLLSRLDARLAARPPAAAAPVPSRRRLNRLFLLYWLVLILCWLPSWLARFPGAVSEDGSRALQQYFGEILKTGDHPYAYTLLLGSVVRLGLRLDGGNLGIALFIALQTLFLSGVFAYTLRDMARMRVPAAARAAVCCLYAFLPVIDCYAAVVVKDVLYAAAFVGYLVVVSHALTDGAACRKRKGWWIAFIVFSCLLLLIRHNGKLIVWPTTLLLMMKGWKTAAPKRRLAQGALLAAPVALALLFQLLVAAPATLAVDSTPDVLGLAMQQTARIARDHGGDVSLRDRENIDWLLSYDELANAYTPRITDPVKRLYRYFDQVTLAEKLDFTGTWLRLAARYPETAFHAFWALNAGYIDPLVDGTAYVDRMTPATSPKYAVTVAATHPAALEGLRGRVLAAEAVWRGLPLVSQLNSVGLYPWLLFLGMGLLGRAKRREYRWAYLPSLITLGACLLAPGYYSCTRYVFPLVYGAPYLLATTGALIAGKGVPGEA